MNKFLKLTSSMVVILFVFTCFTACGEKSNTLDVDIYKAAENVTSSLDFGDAKIMSDNDDGASFTLMFQYGIESEDILNAIEGYVVTSPEANSARTIAIIKFKEGTETSVIEEVKNTITNVYLANLIETTAAYNVDEAEIADKATFETYDNALVLAAYDTNGNSQIFDLIK